MEKRQAIKQNLKTNVSFLYMMASCIYPSKTKAKSLVEECISVLSLKSHGRFLSHQTYDAQNHRALNILSQLLRHRNDDFSNENHGFYHLKPYERFLLILRFRLGLKENEISQILETAESLIIDEIYMAKNNLEKQGDISLELR